MNVFCLCSLYFNYFSKIFILVQNLENRCGPQPNSKLLLNYGFVDEDNRNDRLVVEVRLCV